MKPSRFSLTGALIFGLALLLSGRGSLAQPSFPSAANVPGVSAALAAAPFYTCVTNRYVDAVNGNDSNPGTQAQPWKTIGNADNGTTIWNNIPVPGECVNVLPGTYVLNNTLVIGAGGNASSPTGYVVYRSTVPQGAHLIAGPGLSANNADMIALWAPYLVFDGFEIDGNASTTSGHGIDGCQYGYNPHHFIAINNVIHDVGGAGLNSCASEFIIWRNNVVYNTAGTGPWQSSGISVYQPAALAAGSYTPTAWDSAPYHIQIAYNISHDNKEGAALVPNQGCTPVPPATQGPPCYHTDGEGIIIDTTLGGSVSCPTCGTPYPGNILVLGNVCYNNGGSGVEVFLSQNVTIANNTVYNNFTDPYNPGTARGELLNGGSKNLTWVNNIAIAVPGTGVFANNKPIVTFPVGGSFPDSGTWTRNITYGASRMSNWRSPVSGAGNLLNVDPMLTNLSRHDFVPRKGSPAIGAGVDAGQTLGRPVNIGAY
jgi:parallel beta-helix repeat protein